MRNMRFFGNVRQEEIQKGQSGGKEERRVGQNEDSNVYQRLPRCKGKSTKAHNGSLIGMISREKT